MILGYFSTFAHRLFIVYLSCSLMVNGHSQWINHVLLFSVHIFSVVLFFYCIISLVLFFYSVAVQLSSLSSSMGHQSHPSLTHPSIPHTEQRTQSYHSHLHPFCTYTSDPPTKKTLNVSLPYNLLHIVQQTHTYTRAHTHSSSTLYRAHEESKYI